jgi:penicillin-binding protein 2
MDMTAPSGTTGGRRDAWSKRVLALTILVAGAFVMLLGQLWYLQVLEGSRFRDMSEKNRIRVRPVAAPRGILFDRNGLALVDNRPAFTLSLIPREMEDRNTVLARLSVMLKIPLAELTESLARVPADSLRPVRIRRDLSLEDVAKVEESKLDLPGVVVEVEPTRVYPTSTFAAHLLGYVREVSDEQMKGGRYRRGDMIGQTGLERLLDEHLRGRDGGERIEVDALGRPVQLMQREEPRPGAQVVTTVDRRIQEAAERAMAGRPGAVVVMDPRSGDVLALTSGPAYGLDTFAGNLDREAWARLIKDPTHPLLNRALQAQYPPGSVFKMIVVAAGLQEGTLNPMDRVYCNGTFDYGGRTWKDWKTGGHGHMDLRGAVMQSCDVFFYQYGLKIGPEAIARYARAFGLGAVTGIDLPGEKLGLVPSPAGRRERGRVWHSGETLNVAIGQGALLVTPLQVARMTAAIANGGILWKPRLIQRVERPDGTVAYTESSKMLEHVDLSPVIWAFLRSSMSGVVNEGGTGAAARIPGLEVAGKTGTAQTVANSKSEKGQDHAWFASFAPAKDPQVVVVVMVEGGGHGGSVAAPIARQIYQAIFLEKVAMAVLAGDGS